MGAIAEAMSRFAQPLVDATDGSPEQVQRAFMLSQLCWNLAVLPEEQREELLAKVRPALHMDEREFQEFQHTIVAPMIRRHQEMFPALSRAGSDSLAPPTRAGREPPTPPARRPPVQAYPGTGRNAPCPCGSGKKYKLCCGR